MIEGGKGFQAKYLPDNGFQFLEEGFIYEGSFINVMTVLLIPLNGLNGFLYLVHQSIHTGSACVDALMRTFFNFVDLSKLSCSFI